MSWCDVVVVPSLASTGSSSVIHRAAAYGKPVVASDLPDFRALVDEEGLAIEFVPAGDAVALARTLEHIVKNHELRAQMSAANIAAARMLTPERIAQRYLAVFREMLPEPAYQLPSPSPVAPVRVGPVPAESAVASN